MRVRVRSLQLRRTEVFRRATEGVCLVAVLDALLDETKVRQAHVTSNVEKQILRLEITGSAEIGMRSRERGGRDTRAHTSSWRQSCESTDK